jgi:hypothetical protein
VRVARRLSALLGIAGLTAGLVLVGSGPAVAGSSTTPVRPVAAPPNDTFSGAVAIGGVPFETTQHTGEATTDADDEEANAQCGAPATDASVWYSIEPTTSGALLVDLSMSDFPAGVIVVTGAPGSFGLVMCGPSAVVFPTSAGTTYYLLLFDDQSDGGGNGGSLIVSVTDAPPPPTVDVTVDPIGGFSRRTGAATIRGSITCTGIVDFAFIDITLRQPVGRGEVVGFASFESPCDDTKRLWKVEIVPTFGTRFAGGRAAAATFTVACGPTDCGTEYEEHQVRLRARA